MATKTEICNLALSHLGNGRPISDIDTDTTNEADTLRKYYDVILNQMLRDYKWPFSVDIQALEYTHDAYGGDLSLSAFGSSPDYSDATELLLTAIDTDVDQHVDCTLTTAMVGVTGYVTVVLQGGPSGFASSTDIETIGVFASDAAAGTRITKALTNSDLTYAAYRLKFTSSAGTPTAGVFSAYMAERVGSIVDEWAYSYEYPNDALRIVRVGSDDRVDADDTRTPYKIFHRKQSLDAGDSSFNVKQMILTDEPDACIEYVTNEFLLSGNSDEQIYPDDFAMAFSLRLSTAIAPRITGGDNGFLVRNIWERYFSEVSRALGNAMNEQGMDQPRDSELHRARE